MEVICGAAGSGKTSTALLRLRSLCYMFAARHRRRGDVEPVRVLVLTFNRTLAGYVRSLAERQIDAGLNVDLQIETFGRWAMSELNSPEVASESARVKLRSLAERLGVLTPDYIVKEVEYLLGRFEPENLDQYIATERTGRGTLPRVDRNLRRRILNEVVAPYQEWLQRTGVFDWNTISVRMARDVNPIGYDVVVVDESQDFSANQLRAIRHHLAPEHAVTFVIDTVQRVYARGFTWAEAGFDVRPERFHILRANYRNTSEIAAFAASILNGIGIEGDGALPNLERATSRGPSPIVLYGRYSGQVNWAIDFIQREVNLDNDSVAFLKPKAGAWFGLLRERLNASDIDFVDIIREADWPEGSENVAISTFHSAKGLEFDYVFILGLNNENTPYADAEIDDQGLVLRKLLAVAVARARQAVIIGYKPGEESHLVKYFGKDTFVKVAV